MYCEKGNTYLQQNAQEESGRNELVNVIEIVNKSIGSKSQIINMGCFVSCFVIQMLNRFASAKFCKISLKFSALCKARRPSFLSIEFKHGKSFPISFANAMKSKQDPIKMHTIGVKQMAETYALVRTAQLTIKYPAGVL